MVLYNVEAEDDFVEILNGLAAWKKHPLGYEHAMQYVSDIRQDADTICHKFFHADVRYDSHKKYGAKVHSYKRNANTQWYIIYDWLHYQNIALVNKILNNYLTEI